MVEIDDEDDLLRRIFHYHLRPDGSINSAAFMTTSKKPDPELSVHLAWPTTPAQSLAMGMPGQGVVGLPARLPRAIGLSVRHDPRPGNPGHCLIIGLSSEEQCARLAAGSSPVVAPLPKRT
jgi:hypothetical protein